MRPPFGEKSSRSRPAATIPDPAVSAINRPAPRRSRSDTAENVSPPSIDLRMPRASGWDFLENVRANPRWHTIPVVIVSAHLEEGPDLAGDSGLNIVGQLAKPVSVSDLLAKVEGIIGPAQAVV